MRTFATLILALLTLIPVQNCHAQAVELGAFLVGLGQVRKNVEETINTVDAETAARLRQTQIIVDQTIQQVERVMQSGFDQANNTREKVYANVTSTLSLLQSDLSDKGYLAFLGVNSSLVNLARIADGVPFFKVKTFIFASDPLRVKPRSVDRLLSLYGYFPDVDTDHPASIEIEGTKLVLSQAIGNRLSVDVPSSLLQTGERFVNFEVSIPVKRLFGLRWPEKFKGRFYVEREEPFSFSITRYEVNPQLWASVPAPRAHVERADSARTTNIGLATARDLFSTLVNDDTRYVMSTAQFAAVVAPVGAGNKPCDCCDASSGRLESWDAHTVRWQLYAPTCPSKWCSATYHCGGGGTNAEISIAPTFKVKRRGVAEEAIASSSSYRMKRLSSSPSQTLGEWSSVVVRGEFRDGAEFYSDQVRLTSGVPTGNSRYWRAEVAGSSLVVKTR